MNNIHNIDIRTLIVALLWTVTVWGQYPNDADCRWNVGDLDSTEEVTVDVGYARDGRHQPFGRVCGQRSA